MAPQHRESAANASAVVVAAAALPGDNKAMTLNYDAFAAADERRAAAPYWLPDAAWASAALVRAAPETRRKWGWRGLDWAFEAAIRCKVRKALRKAPRVRRVARVRPLAPVARDK